MNKVCIVTPIYEKELTDFQKCTLVNISKVFQTRDRFIICPDRIKNYSYYASLIKLGYKTKFFKDEVFTSINSYNIMCLSLWFYEEFKDYDYILIAQTDTWSFRDNLDYWINSGYDYVGAPMCIACPHTGNNESCNKNYSSEHVGNGGLSLRKVSKIIEVIKKDQIEITSMINENRMCPEDWFFARNSDVKKPDCHKAKEFSLEESVCFHSNNKDLITDGWHKANVYEGHDLPLIQFNNYNKILLKEFNS